ncbi:MAG: hypothetical protein [Microvirus sp.]|nr:MAG: hypothetical protein [Microvirus sp.]
MNSFDDLIRMLELREKRQREALELTVKQLSEARAAAAVRPAKAQ